jgi:two-component system, cell cycle response regulator
MPSGDRRARPSHVPKTLAASENPDLGQEVARLVKAPHRPVLVVLTGNELGTRVVVDRSLLIGRAPEADLKLSDQLISWHHARIEDRGDGFALSDVGSTNGTTVNGETKAEFLLTPNDRIVFGATAVSFEQEDALKGAYNEQVERLLNIDDLSGLLVRRKFDADFATLLDAARATKKPLAFLAMDMDGIKKINDTHGHLFGAYTIGQAGHIIATLIQNRGIGCRFGGDEFLAALPGLDADGASAMAESILKAINTMPFVRDGITLKPGISIGVAAFPADASDTAALFQRADEALYRAKQGGRNRVSR